MARVRIALTLGAMLSIGALLHVAQAAETKHSKVTVVNQSDWQLDHFFMSPADKTDWGPDQLGEGVIESVDLCKDNAEWKITSKELLACQAKTQ